jgi:hypothetical protein
MSAKGKGWKHSIGRSWQRLRERDAQWQGTRLIGFRLYSP